MWQKILVVPSQFSLIFVASIKETKRLKKENILVHYERHQDRKLKAICPKNKKYEKQMGQNWSQCLWQNGKKSADWNGYTNRKSKQIPHTHTHTHEKQS